MIDYEWRSSNMWQSFRHELIHKKRVPEPTLTGEWMQGYQEETVCEISLQEWYPEIPIEIPATESVIELDYNGKFLTLIEPEVTDISEYISENIHMK